MSDFKHKRTDSPKDTSTQSEGMTGSEKAFAGLWYKFIDEPECRSITDQMWSATARINELAKTDRQAAMVELKKIVPGIHESADIIFPFTIDYPTRLTVGEGTFINMGFLHLSGGKVTLGKNCFLGPNAHFYTPNHCIEDLELRRAGWQYDASISVGDDVWFGGDVIVTPGVRIGSNVVVGAGSVVTKDVPDNCVIGGNPARILKRL
ncbi:MAG: sugar O-acetyltransferase [Candidatus Ancillula sp.]|nr:sugar O-acetyltransferase [Candidatus Ancillula sp.]